MNAFKARSMAGRVPFLQRGASCIHGVWCFSIPPAFHFLDAELPSAFSCGFSLMRHLGLSSKDGLGVNQALATRQANK